MNEAKIRTRHLKYFVQLAERAEIGLRGPEQTTWYLHVNDEHDNLRAALEWAGKTDLEAGLYISGRLNRYWEDFNVSEGIRWLEKLLQNAVSRNYPPARARALQTYAYLVLRLQQFAKAHISAQECLELQRRLGDRSGELDILLVLWQIADHSGEKEAALGFIQQAHDIAPSLNDAWRQANMLNIFGGYHKRPSYIEEASALYRQVGDWRSLSRILVAQAMSSLGNGDIESAQKYLDEAAPLGEVNNRLGIWDEIVKSVVALVRGDYEQAYTLAKQALVRAHESGNRMNYTWMRVRFSYVVLRMGNLNEAREGFTEMARQFLNDHYDIGVVFSLEGMAELYNRLYRK